MMNLTSLVQEPWLNDIQFGNPGAALFIIAYIGFYGLGIICVFGQQLKETQRSRYELPAHFLKTLWDVPNKNKLYEELADIDRLTRIFQGYFADHESCTTITKDELHAMADERARACASKYREKLRRLHISHTDYYLDTVPRLFDKDQHSQRSSSESTTLITHAAVLNTIIDYSYRHDREDPMWSVSVV